MKKGNWQTLVNVKQCRLGKGVFAVKKFSAGEKISRITGRVTKSPRPEKEESYQDYGDGLYLEPYSPFRYLNHSCSANVELELELHSNGKRSLNLLAVRDIEVGEELVNDYAWDDFDPVPCLCQSKDCRGWIVSKKSANKIKQKKLSFTKFPSEFEEMLSSRGREFLNQKSSAPDGLSGPGAVRVFDGLISNRYCRETALLLQASFRSIVKRLVVPIPVEATLDMEESYGEMLEKTMDVYTVELNGVHSRASRVADAIGLKGMMLSESFHKFAEVLSQFRLEPEPDLQIHCHEEGQYTGPHNDYFPEFEDANKGYIDIQITFCTSGVKDQYFVYEKDGLLSEVVNVAKSGLINVCHLPFWHYTTPLQIEHGDIVGRRWLIVASFAIQD